MATLAIATLMMLSMAFFKVTGAASSEVLEEVDQKAAFYLAEAGVAEAIEALRSGSTGNVATAQTPAFLSNGVVWVEATDLGNDQTRLVATGLKGSGRAALEVVVSTSGGAPMFTAMIASDDDLNIDSNQLIDSFDSSLGTYASQAVNSKNGKTYALANGHMTSNSKIIVSSNTGIFGDALPGPSSNLSLDSGSFVTGTTLPRTDPFPMPALPVPSIPSTGTLKVSGTHTLYAGNHGFDSLNVTSNATLVVQGPADIVTSGDFLMSSNSIIEVDATNGPVTFYNEGTVKLNGNSHFEVAPGSPMDVVFVVTSKNGVSFPGGMEFHGGIYAPNGKIVIDGNSEFFGAVVAQSVTMSSGTDFHFDEYLMNRNLTGGAGVTISVLSWNLAPLPDEIPAGDRRDPFSMLDLDQADLPKPVDAWDMAEVKAGG